jgi:hypothetical protein
LAAVHHTNAGTAENGILLHDQLFLQMPWAHWHCISRSQ